MLEIVDGRFKDFSLDCKVPNSGLEGFGEALNGGVADTIIAQTEAEAGGWLFEFDKAIADGLVELRVLGFEVGIDVDGAAEFSAGEDFLYAKRMNGDVGKW